MTHSTNGTGAATGDVSGSAPGQNAAGASPALVRLMLGLEESAALDRAVTALEPMAASLIAGDARRAVLHGRLLGHAVHPLLTDLPLGSWTSALVLDLTGGSRPAAARLVGFGVLTAVPTAVAGWAEWAVAEQAAKRVGVVHAGANTLALSLYGGSWLVRRRGHHAAGIALSLVATAVVSAGGYLGSHLTLARKVSTRDPAFDAEPLAAQA